MLDFEGCVLIGYAVEIESAAVNPGAWRGIVCLQDTFSHQLYSNWTPHPLSSISAVLQDLNYA